MYTYHESVHYISHKKNISCIRVSISLDCICFGLVGRQYHNKRNFAFSEEKSKELYQPAPFPQAYYEWWEGKSLEEKNRSNDVVLLQTVLK